MSGSSFKFTQLSFASEVKDWINEIIHSLSLRFDCADIEVKDPSKKRADVILWEKRPVKPALLMEIWDARTPPWEYALDSALSKAWKNNIPHFVVWNLTHFYCWETFAGGEAIDKLWWPHSGVSEVVCEALTYDDAILKYDESIRKYLETFLREFEQIYYGIKARPLLGVDERFIYRLRGAIHALSIPIFEHIKRMVAEDVEFKRGLGRYFREQGWSFKGVDEDFEKVARQYVYLLVNKILFYNVLRSMPGYGRHLPKIAIPEVGLTGRVLKNRLNSYFKRAYDATGNYETILLTDFLDSLTPPDDVAGVLKDFIHKIGEHDFSKINYEVLGNIFQRLIPEDERHKLGQYFTRPDVVDLIVGFCVRSADDRVLDGGCGAGTFLVRSYVRKKILNPNKTHRDIIRDLYGIDIAKFPAHLSIINLASRDLSEVENYPNILHGDFFNTLPGKEYLSAEVRVETLSGREKFIKMPEAFDAVVMNPPYTRQEEMEDVLEEEKKKAYKRCIEDWKAMSKYRGKEPKLSKRSSIYVHFFIHGGSFLKEGGRLGLITSNSWLDVDYGGDLQRFFLENFKVKAIIESKVERWFEDADINTAITILERCSNPEERNNNMVRFVQLKKPLAEFIPPVENENERWAYVEKLIEFIESKEGYYEDDRIRVFTKTQKELWDEGYDEEKEEYMGSKWGKYIRAPEIFFKVLGKEKNLFIPLKEVAEVKRGFTTGANEFFYLTEEEIQRWSIEREFWMHPLKKDEEVPVSEDVWKDKGGEYFKKSQYTAKLSIDEVLRDDGHVYWIPNYVIKSPRECKSILINPRDLKYRVLMVHKNKSELRGTNVLKYIERGENQGFHLRPTCKSRQRWYDINIVNYPLVWRSTYDVSFAVFYNKDKVAIDKVLYGILPKKEDEWILCTLLNASIVAIFAEMHGTVQLGQGALFTAVYEIEKMPIINPLRLSSSVKKELRQIMEKLHQTSIDSVFEEIGANSPEEVSLDKVKPDRRELDRIIMGEILGLTEEEQLEVYRAVIDLVKSRIERAKSVQKRRKVAELDIDELVDSVLKDVERVHGIQAKRFPEDYIGGCPYRVVEVPRGSRVEAGFDIKEGPYVQIDGEKIKCNSIYEAKFIEYAVLAGKTRVTIPTDEGVLRRAVEERAKLLKDARARLEEFLNETIADRKLREKVRFEAFRRLGI